MTAGYGGTRAGSLEAEPAKEIQSVAGGDLFEITVADAYPSGYQDTVDRARRETIADWLSANGVQ